MKRMVTLAALALIALLLIGCTQQQALGLFNAGIETLGNAPVLISKGLTGKRSFGNDRYTGKYEGKYDNVTGFECLFGGTSLTTHEDATVSCSLTVQSGTAQLRFQSLDDDPVVLCEQGETCETTISLPAGSNYLNLITTDFTGDITLTVQ